MLLQAGCKRLVAILGSAPQFASMKLNLHEEGLLLLSARPVVTVVHLGVPIKIVVRLAPPGLGGRQTAVIMCGQAAADAGKVAGLLKQFGNRPNPIRQLDAVLPSPTPVMMGTDRVLVHAGDHGGAKGRAYRRGGIGPSEEQSVLRQLVNCGRLNSLFAVTGKIGRHVVDHEPENIGLVWDFRNSARQSQSEKKDRQQSFHGKVSSCRIHFKVAR